MIKKLRLKNWKSFEDATLHIDPLTIIIGANASGKSNLLDALMFLYRISSGVGVFEAIEGGPGLSALRGGMEWICLKPKNQFILEVTTSGFNENEEFLYEITVEISDVTALILDEKLTQLLWVKGEVGPIEETLIAMSVGPGISKFKIKRDNTKNEERIDYKEINLDTSSLDQPVKHQYSILPSFKQTRTNAEAGKIIDHVLKQLRSIFVFDPVPSHMRGFSRLSNDLNSDGSNIAGVLAHLVSPRKDKIESLLTSHIRALPERDILKVWAERVGKFQTDAMLYCKESWEGTSTQEIDARGMSDGTLRYIAIVTALLTRDEWSLLVIDEVDNALHPSRSNQLLNMLKELGKERNIDVIVTTHNPALLDAAGPSMVPFIAVAHRNDVSGVSELKLFEDIEALPKLLAYGSLGKLSADGRIEKALKQEDTK